ncbi:MAG: peptidase U32 family protein [Luteolibacter sp.]
MTELLSPAGNWDCARAAVAAGADAIYFGLPAFNARLRADNFSEDDLPELMDYLHKHGVKGFVAMNTLIFTDELEAAEKQLRIIAEAGVDALIIQDLGLAKMARTIAPDVELHASTQMTITSPEGLSFLESIFPMERAVLARELSLKEIERFKSPTSVTPLEVFVHGALCVAYSGQCLTSESLGQRSANRGECAQACRMPYEIVVDGETRDLGEHRYLLSPQDLAAVDVIPELVAAGVKSFKIEGRLKTPEYVAAVTRVYRKALDAASNTSEEIPPVTAEDKYSLEMTFSRGLTTGWLAGTNHPYLTHGKFGKKRGPFLGTIIEAQNGWIRLDTPPSEQTPPLKAGDGIVFDAGENRDLEQGASIWKIENDRIVFHRNYSGINFNRIRPGVTLYKTADPALESSIRKFWQTAKPKLKKSPLHLTVTGQPGEPLALSSGNVSVSTSIPISEASNRPLSKETLTQQLSKLGDTPFELASLDNQLQGNCHLPISALNQARRDLVAKLVANGTRTSVRSTTSTSTSTLFPLITNLIPPPGGPPAGHVANSSGPCRSAPFSALGTPSLSVLTRTTDQVTAALESGIPRIYCDFEDPRRYKEAVALAEGTPSKIILATPRIIKPGETGYLKLIERAEPAGLLLRNLHALQHFKDHTHLEKIGDFSLNVANPLTAKILIESAALDRLTISYDLNISQVINLIEKTPPHWLELTLHQHMPMFHMEHCVFCTFLSSGTTYKDCGRPCEKHVVHLRDRVGQLHRLQADVGCRNTLFNGRAQTGARFFKSLLGSGLQNYRIELLDEEHADAYSTIRAYQELLEERITPENLLTRIHATEKLGVTEGTLA